MIIEKRVNVYYHHPMATTVRVPKKEYDDLVEKKLRYEYLRHVLEEDIFSPPPARNTKGMIAAFKKTGLYSAAFLNSMERGLRRSSHFRS